MLFWQEENEKKKEMEGEVGLSDRWVLPDLSVFVPLFSLTYHIILSFCISAMRRRKGPFKHIKFGTNIDLSDEKKWVTG